MAYSTSARLALFRAGLVSISLASFVLLPGERAVAAPPPPPITTSYYMASASTTSSYLNGCSAGQALATRTSSATVVFILDYGDPLVKNGVYGADTFTAGFASVDDIENSAWWFGWGVFHCSAGNRNLYLLVGVGTNNHGSNVTSAHGTAWARMIHRLNDSWYNVGITSLGYAAGASDMELNWSSASTARSWVDGYAYGANHEVANQQTFYPRLFDYGDAAGCAPYGSCINNWTQGDVVYVAYSAYQTHSSPSNSTGIVFPEPLPEIYNSASAVVNGVTSTANAAQWYRLSLYEDLNSNFPGPMPVDGPLTQTGACATHPCDASLKNKPANAWAQLYDALNSDSRTAAAALGMFAVSDITYQ